MRCVLAYVLTAAICIAVAPTSTFAEPQPQKIPQQGKIQGELETIKRTLDADKAKQKAATQREKRLKRDVQTLNRNLIAVAADTQAIETELSELEIRIDHLEKDRKKTRAILAENRSMNRHILAALVRLARYPSEAVVAQSMPPGDLVRSAILVRSSVPLIEVRARHLSETLKNYGAIERELTERRRLLATRTTNLEERKGKLATLLTKKKSLRKKKLAESRKFEKRVAALSRKARGLKDLLSRLDTERRERMRKASTQVVSKRKAEQETASRKQAAAAISKARGKLKIPVAGKVVGRYGQKLGKGVSRKGIDIQTRADARVVAPYDGQVVFAGPFRGYGRLLIIEHGEGYHSLLAGMEHIDGALGQWVVAGEPVGRMGKTATKRPTLYLEFRRGGQPINPMPWLATRKRG